MNNISKNRTCMRVWVSPKANFPPFAQPMAVSYFSLDQDRKFTPDNSQLRYMYLPKDVDGLGWDLNHGLDKVQRSDHADRNEKIDNLLRGMLASGLSINQEVASFMSYRGLLTRVMTTPYEQNEGWEILVSKYRGVLFMCAQETPDQRRKRMSKNEFVKRCCSWGFKFEQYMSTDQPGCPPDIEMPVKENEEFCCLFRTKLNDRRLLYGAEMDAVTSDVPLEDCLEDLMLAEFIELKTSRKIDSVRQERNFKRFKLLNWWAQNFLVNVANIICGFRDDRGVIQNISFYKVNEIPKLAKDLWIPAVCMTFLDQFLTFVQRTVWECPHSNDPNTVWRFRWEPGVHFVTGDMINGRSQYSFLPDWFISSVNARESHPLEFCIRIHSSRHEKELNNNDDQKTYTAKVFTMAKDLGDQRAKNKRPPSPRSIIMAQKGIKPSTAPKESGSAEASGAPGSQPNTSASPSVCDSANNHQPSVDTKAESTTQSHNSRSSSHAANAHTSARSVKGPPKRRHRRRAREDHLSHLQSHSSHHRGSEKSRSSTFQSLSQFRLQPQLLRKTNNTETVSELVMQNTAPSSPLTIAASQDQFSAVLPPQSSYSSSDMHPATISHTEVVYGSSYGTLDDGSFLVPQSSEELSPSNSADHFSSPSFLTSSPSEDSYQQHAMLSSPLPAGSLMGDCYSPNAFPVDDLPPATYLVSPDSEYVNQHTYLQSSLAVEHGTERSYLTSADGVEYVTQPSFMQVNQPVELQASDMYLNEASEDLLSSSLLSPVGSLSQTYLTSNPDISSDDIQTAEGSLTTINQLTPSAYMPPVSTANHLTLQM